MKVTRYLARNTRGSMANWGCDCKENVSPRLTPCSSLTHPTFWPPGRPTTSHNWPFARFWRMTATRHTANFPRSSDSFFRHSSIFEKILSNSLPSMSPLPPFPAYTATQISAANSVGNFCFSDITMETDLFSFLLFTSAFLTTLREEKRG